MPATLAPEQTARLVRGRAGARQVAGGTRGPGQGEQHVGPFDLHQRTCHERTLHDAERVGGQSRGEVGGALVPDEVDVGDPEGVEALTRLGVQLEGARQVALQERDPALVVDPHGDLGVHLESRVDRVRLVEGPTSRVEVPQPDPGQTLQVEGPRPPHLVS